MGVDVINVFPFILGLVLGLKGSAHPRHGYFFFF